MTLSLDPPTFAVLCPKCEKALARLTLDKRELQLSPEVCVRWRCDIKCRGCGYVYRWRPNRA